MKAELNKTFNIFVSVLLLVMTSLILAKNEYKLIVLLTTILLFIVFGLFYRFFYCFDRFKKREKFFTLLGQFLIFNFIQMIFISFSSKELIINILINDMIYILSVALIYRRISFRDTVYASIICYLTIPFVFNNIGYSIIGFLIILNIYSMISVEYHDSLSEKHILKYFIIGTTTFLLVWVMPIWIIIFLFYNLMLYRNVKKKSFIAISCITFLSAISCFLMVSLFSITNLDISNCGVGNDNFFILEQSLFLMLLISDCVCSISVNKSEKYEFESLRVNNFYLFGIFILVISELFNNVLIALPILVSSYAITNHQFRYIAKVNYLRRYIRAGEVKKISVVIPNFNYENYIIERIDSILSQTYPIYELIILDDCSTDNSVSVIKDKINSLQNTTDLKIKFIANSENSGNVFRQWEKAFEYSTGDYLWIAEADDLCDKHFLNVVMHGFQNKKVVLSYAESKAIDENGECFMKDLREWIDQHKTNHYLKSYINDGKKEMEQVLCTNNTIPNASGVVFKIDKNINVKEYLKEAQEYKLAGDWYFYAKYLMHGSICYSSDSLNYHRIHRNSVTTTTDGYLRYCEICRIQNMISDSVNLSNDAKNRIALTRKRLQMEFCISKDELKYENIELNKLVEGRNISDDILLSIIIPVYNTEKYLKKCLNSFINTLPEKTEVLIINDGSLDHSEDIIDEYALKYPAIKYIKKENGGLSSVKNVGLKESKGRYIIFLDSDDYVSSDMYNTMLKKAIDEEADIVCCDVLEVHEDNRLEYVSSKTYSREGLLKYIDNPFMAASWSKMVKKDLYSGLNFPEGLNNEDVAVTPQLFIRSKKTVHIPSPFYKYVQRAGSIQNSGFSEKRFVIFETSKMCLNAIEKYGHSIYEQVQYSITTHQLLAILIFLVREVSNDDERMEFIKIFCQKFDEMQFKINPNENVFVQEYMVSIHKPKLVENVVEKNYEKIDEIIKMRN